MAHFDTVSQYDDAATWWQATTERLVVPSVESALVDIGTDSGDRADAYCAVYGPAKSLAFVDSTPTMPDVAARTPETAGAGHVCTVQASFSDIPSDAACLTVRCAHDIEHLDDPQSAISNPACLIAPRGRLLLFISRRHWCQWFVRIRWRHCWYVKAAVRHMAEAAGRSCDAVMIAASGSMSRTTPACLPRPNA
ncbi:methyltransferase domain-containing protein [uncultured Tateyamaria sp.]|uniref:methyltransferase domain-containing protein n=1 Tax=uncultured Tateyamaria sp. TaxID=455651 RepID=UPI0026216A1B|nr:methyltransferase domain-containing protein [uncultured Tateyamaria sp.]